MSSVFRPLIVEDWEPLPKTSSFTMYRHRQQTDTLLSLLQQDEKVWVDRQILRTRTAMGLFYGQASLEGMEASLTLPSDEVLQQCQQILRHEAWSHKAALGQNCYWNIFGSNIVSSDTGAFIVGISAHTIDRLLNILRPYRRLDQDLQLGYAIPLVEFQAPCSHHDALAL